MERTISSKNLGRKIEVGGIVFKEGKNLYIAESYARAKILNPDIFEYKIPRYATVKGELTISMKKGYPEFAIKVESYET